ncbi:hypothetical protein ACFL0F_01185, partial [Patescibacteria group bacterium]
TGWQYSSADWELKITPDFFPLESLEWTSLGNNSNYKLSDGLVGFGKDIEVDDFSPLVVGGQPWGVSSGNNSSLRDWAKPILSVGQKALVAGGSYGSGRVIWTGFDIPGHIGAFEDNPEEIEFFHEIMKYLLVGKEGKIISSDFDRLYPDEVEISVGGNTNKKTAVYWKEAYYPDFKASYISDGKKKNLDAYKAGPGMTLFVLPNTSAGSKIVYKYKTPPVIIMARLVSLGTLVILILFVVKPNLFGRAKKKFISKKEGEKPRGRIVKKMFGGGVDENIDY